MDFVLCVLIIAFYLLVIPFGAFIASLTFPIKRKSVSWLLGSIWPLTIAVCDVILFLSLIKEGIDKIIKSR